MFFFNDTATTEIYTLSLHDALPICGSTHARPLSVATQIRPSDACATRVPQTLEPSGPGRPSSWSKDRKSTRMNSSHANISYAVFCLKKNKKRSSYNKLELKVQRCMK